MTDFNIRESVVRKIISGDRTILEVDASDVFLAPGHWPSWIVLTSEVEGIGTARRYKWLKYDRSGDEIHGCVYHPVDKDQPTLYIRND